MIEMLVVIAILAVVATLAFFGVSRARTSANSAVSVANLRQWGGLMLQFQQEFGRFPPANITTGDDSTKAIRESHGVSAYSGWDEFFARNLNLDPANVTSEDEKLFHHPGDKAEDTFSPPRPRRTYAMVRGNNAIGRSNTLSLGLVNIPDPSRTLLLTERPPAAKAWVAFSASGSNVDSPQQQLSGQPNLNGNGKFNYLFADGHVEGLHPQDTIGSGSLAQPKGMWTVVEND
jgi:prepilin-type processing-associated H-X9-DG protein